jgi:hypothetical protein
VVILLGNFLLIFRRCARSYCPKDLHIRHEIGALLEEGPHLFRKLADAEVLYSTDQRISYREMTSVLVD